MLYNLTMKLFKRIGILAFVGLLSFSACKKYEDGPGLSFRSKATRIANTWKYKSYVVNGVERAGEPEFQTTKQFWSASGELGTTFINQTTGIATTIPGKWELQENNTKIRVTQNNVIQGIPETVTNYSILRLSNNEMWLRSADFSTDIHYVPSK